MLSIQLSTFIFRGFVLFIYQNSLFPQLISVHWHEGRVLAPCIAAEALMCEWLRVSHVPGSWL